MISSQTIDSKTKPSILIKARAYTLPILELHTSDLELINEDLEQRNKLSPNFFKQTPIVVDLKNCQEHGKLKALVQTIEQHGLVVMALSHAEKGLDEDIKSLNLNLLDQFSPKELPESQPTPIQTNKTKTIHTPIRTGQQVINQEGDLIITKATSSGTEIIAKGSIVVMSTLRGKALAGVGGEEHSEIICQSLQAELVSIAGVYLTSEQLESYWNYPVRISLDEQTLKIDTI